MDRRLPGQLSDQQISDAFRAAQFSPEELEGFTKKVREKINELAAAVKNPLQEM